MGPTLKRTFRIAAYVAALVVVMLLFFAGLSQTDFFKERIRIILVSSLSSRLNGSIKLGTLGGNFITEITLDSLEVYYRDELFLKTGKVTVQYDPLTLLKKKLTFKYFIVEQPKIHFVRSPRGEWNFANLVKPTGDTSKGSLGWDIYLTDLELKNGIMTLFDSTATTTLAGELPDTLKHFDYARFSLKDINVQLKAAILKEDVKAHLVHASFYSDQPAFELTHATGDVGLSTDGIFANNVILQSSHSYIELDGGVHLLNLFEPQNMEELRRDSAKVTLKAKNVDFSELRTLIPSLGFLDGSAFMDLAVDGEFGNLTIRRLNIKAYDNIVNVSGTVKNLQRAERLDLDLFVGAPSLNPADASRLLPGLGLPHYNKVGRSSLNIQFAGNPLNFRTRTILKGGFGNCEVAGSVNLEKKEPSYGLKFSTTRLDVAALTADPELKLVLSSSGGLKGEGISLNGLNSTLDIRIDSSRVRNISLDSARMTLTARSRKLEGTVRLAAQKMRATISAHADLTSKDHPEFGGEVSLRDINLARVLDNPRYESDITMEGTISGSGRTIDDLNSDTKLTLYPSTFQGHDVSSQEIRVFLDQQNFDSKRLSLQSSIVDLDLNGKFDLDLGAAVLIHQTGNLLETTLEHALPAESIKVKHSEFKIPPHTPAQRRMDFDYTLHVKDLEPVATLIEGRRFDGRGTLTGAVHGTDEQLSFSCTGSVDEFFLGSYEQGFLLNRTTIALKLDSLADTRTLDQLSGELKLGVGNALVNGTTIDSFALALGYHNYKGTISINGTVDSLYSIVMAGQTAVQPHTYAFDFDSLTVRTGEYRWKNDQDVQFRLNFDGTRVMHALMTRNGEQFSLTGVLHHNGEFNFDALLNDYDLASLGYLTRNPVLLRPDQGFRGRASAKLHLAGSTSSPVITFDASSDSIFYRQTRIGSVGAGIRYQDSIATLDLTVKRSPRDSVPSLSVKGTLPVNLAFSGVKERFPDEPQHIQVLSKGFDLSVLDPLHSEFQDVRGMLYADISVAGTPRDPEYTGSIKLSDVEFTFAPNNVPYALSANFEATRNKIVVKSLVVRSLLGTVAPGEAQVTGSLSIKNYQIDSLDLIAMGQFLLMSEATKKTRAAIYGILPTETGPEGLHLVGTISHPYLSGNLYLQGANLTSPPTYETEGSSSQLSLNYIVVDDTSKQVAQPARTSKFYAGNEIKPVVNRTAEDRTVKTTFLDRLRYNVSIETRGNNAIKMIFTPSTNEELYAELEGKVSLVNNRGYASLTGEITVSPNSYYNFFKRFDASGKLKFVGQWDNPELEIEATYVGYRTDPAHDSLQQKVIVQLNITGTRNEPKLAMSMKVQLSPGEEPVDWTTEARGGDVQSDAISFILTGRFRDDLSSKERGDIATTVGSTAGSGFTVGLLSGVLSDFLRQEFPFIRSAELNYEGGNVGQGANVRLSGEAFKGYWQVGGKILNDIGNANVSYSMSLGDVLKASSIHNLFLEIQRRVEGDLSEERKLTNEARLFYRFSF
jgi:translocation-and-assembly-module (TAM) inner membrane subunit TamB-like protein